MKSYNKNQENVIFTILTALLPNLFPGEKIVTMQHTDKACHVTYFPTMLRQLEPSDEAKLKDVGLAWEHNEGYQSGQRYYQPAIKISFPEFFSDSSRAVDDNSLKVMFNQ